MVMGEVVYVDEEFPSEATTSKTTLSSLSKLPTPSKMSLITDDVFEMVLEFPEVSVTVQFHGIGQSPILLEIQVPFQIHHLLSMTS